MNPTDSTHDPEADSYREAAARLAFTLKALDGSLRLAVLKRIARQGDETGFPKLLKLLLIIGESNDMEAKRALAELFSLGLRSMDLPSGDLTAWGASHFWQSGPDQTFNPSTLMSVPTRRLDPLEYLTVWYSQKTQRPFLSKSTYQYALAGLIHLVNLSPDARQLYPRKILSDLSAAAEGAYTRSTRTRLQALANSWLAGAEPEIVAASAAAD